MARYSRRHDRVVPRSWWSLFLRLGGWISLGVGVLLLVVTAFSASQLRLADRFDRDGALAYAAVEGKRIAVRTDSDGDTFEDHFVTLRFKARGLPGQTVEASVTRDYHDRVAVGDQVPIRYLVDAPGIVETDMGQYRRAGVVMRWIGLVLGLAGLAALYAFGLQATRAVKVRRDGQKRYAEVTGIRDVPVSVQGRRQGRLVWREEDGQVGESLMRSASWLRETYRRGDRIVVFRLGQHAFWEGDVGPPRREVPPGREG